MIWVLCSVLLRSRLCACLDLRVVGFVRAVGGFARYLEFVTG